MSGCGSRLLRAPAAALTRRAVVQHPRRRFFASTSSAAAGAHASDEDATTTAATTSSHRQQQRLRRRTDVAVPPPAFLFESAATQARRRSPPARPLPSSTTEEWTALPVADLLQWLTKVPKGFENFVPKKRSGGDDKKKEDKEGESSTTSAGNAEKKADGGPFSSFGGGGGSSGGGGGGGKNQGDGPPMPGLGAAFVTLLVVYLMLKLDRDADDPDHQSDFLGVREVTWTDFYNYMLVPGDVEKIVVTSNNTTARVFLRPGARGVPKRASSAARSSTGRARVGSTAAGAGRAAPGGGRGGAGIDEDIDEDTVMEMHASGDGAGERSAPGASSSHPPHQLVYRFAIGTVESFERKLDQAQRDLGIDPHDFVPVQYASDSTVATELLSTVPSLLLIGVMVAMLRGMGGAAGGGGGAGGRGGMGGIFQFGKSNAKKINKEDVSVTFKDVAGCDEAKKEIMEFVDFLQDSTLFTKLGAKIPKGALLTGPPGTGKTLLAKAVAGEAQVPFYSISGSDFIEMFVGVGPSRVRDLFKEARANAPCIIFIDEIDAVGRQRGRGGVGGNDERENTLNQLLVEMDGFSPSEGVVVLAGTNRVDILDQALKRPGRFDRQISVDMPDLKGRKEIFLVHLQGITLDGNLDDIASRLAGLTPGFAGADIANICNEAAIVAARRKADAVSIEDFEKATDRIIGGLESNKIMSKEERSIVAHHEAGHAVAGWFLEHADPLLKVTIIPRSSGALGYAQYLPKEVFLRTEDQIMDIVCMALAGRAAEETFFGSVTTGAADDLRRVTDLVYNMIKLYGMGKGVGQLSFPKDPNAMFEEKPYSSKTAKAMDEEARSMVDAAYQRTLDLMKEKKKEVDMVANLLLDKETITHDDIIDLIGPRPFKGDDAYNEFVSMRQADKEAREKKEAEKEKKAESEPDSSDKDDSGSGLAPGLL